MTCNVSPQESTRQGAVNMTFMWQYATSAIYRCLFLNKQQLMSVVQCDISFSRLRIVDKVLHRAVGINILHKKQH